MKIIICGVGAIGSNLVAELVPDLKGKHGITILDKDKVEERNLNTQFFLPDQIGLSKVDALQFNIYRNFNREIDIIEAELKQDKNEYGQMESGKWDLVIDCFDNYYARALVQTAWEGRNHYKTDFHVLHVGFSNNYTFAIEWSNNYHTPSDITSGFDICTMSGAAAFVASVASLGALVAEEFIFNNKRLEITGGKFTHSLIK